MEKGFWKSFLVSTFAVASLALFLPAKSRAAHLLPQDPSRAINRITADHPDWLVIDVRGVPKEPKEAFAFVREKLAAHPFIQELFLTAKGLEVNKDGQLSLLNFSEEETNKRVKKLFLFLESYHGRPAGKETPSYRKAWAAASDFSTAKKDGDWDRKALLRFLSLALDDQAEGVAGSILAGEQSQTNRLGLQVIVAGADEGIRENAVVWHEEGHGRQEAFVPDRHLVKDSRFSSGEDLLKAKEATHDTMESVFVLHWKELNADIAGIFQSYAHQDKAGAESLIDLRGKDFLRSEEVLRGKTQKGRPLEALALFSYQHQTSLQEVTRFLDSVVARDWAGVEATLRDVYNASPRLNMKTDEKEEAILSTMKRLKKWNVNGFGFDEKGRSDPDKADFLCALFADKLSFNGKQLTALMALGFGHYENGRQVGEGPIEEALALAETAIGKVSCHLGREATELSAEQRGFLRASFHAATAPDQKEAACRRPSLGDAFLDAVTKQLNLKIGF